MKRLQKVEKQRAIYASYPFCWNFPLHHLILLLSWKFSAIMQVKCLQCSSLDRVPFLNQKVLKIKSTHTKKKIIWLHSSAPSSLALYIDNKDNFQHWFTITILGILSICWKYSYKKKKSEPSNCYCLPLDLTCAILINSHFTTPSCPPILSH